MTLPYPPPKYMFAVLQILDNFYLVTITKKIVKVTIK